MKDTGTTRTRYGAAVVLLAPAVVAAGMISHPFIGFGPPDPEVIGTVVAAEPIRWGVAHLIVAVGSGLTIMAFLALRDYLREAGESRWSARGVPAIVLGSTLFTILPALEFAPLAAVETGGNVTDAQSALLPWFLPILLTGAFTFAIGATCFAKAIADSAILSRPLTWLVVTSLVAMAAARFVPLAAVQLYAQAAVGLLAMWPLGLRMWRHDGFDHARPDARGIAETPEVKTAARRRS